ncbi:Multicopper oxidase [Ceratobasidium sp. AG-Ba]|nr:Multicopper oxidase [Ceratobasidium sp. AG-Ba]
MSLLKRLDGDDSMYREQAFAISEWRFRREPIRTGNLAEASSIMLTDQTPFWIFVQNQLTLGRLEYSKRLYNVYPLLDFLDSSDSSLSFYSSLAFGSAVMARFRLLRATSALSLLTSFATARDVQYIFNIENGNVAPDGVVRNGVLVNGMFPGPLITANKDDRIEIMVNNKLTNSTMRRSTTIVGNAQDDGPAFVTQCPIAPMASYTYRIPLNGQSGTYWYHSHLATQWFAYILSLMVKSIVNNSSDPQDPYLKYYDVDDESTVFTLADWYHTSAKIIEESHNFRRTVPDSATSPKRD